MSKLGTKNVAAGSGALPKSFGPGNHTCKINSVRLNRPSFAKEGVPTYYIELDLETEPLGGAFEGFFINKDNESLGKHLGQTARIKTDKWAYKDSAYKGKTFLMTDSIIRFLKNLCIELGSDWMDKADGKYDTIEAMVEAFAKAAPFDGVFLKWCIGGQQVTKENGHPGFFLNLPKYERGYKLFSAIDSAESLMVYDAPLHLEIKDDPNAEPVNSIPAKEEAAEELPWETEDSDETFVV